VANISLQRTRTRVRAAELGSFGVPDIGRALVTAFMVIGVSNYLMATQPLWRPPVGPAETLVFLDMAAGDVQESTVDAAMQSDLRGDFGEFRASFAMGWAVRDGLVTESRIRRAFGAYGCDRVAAQTWFGCRHALEAFELVVKSGPLKKVQLPLCIRDGSNLFSKDYPMFNEAVYRSFGDPEIIALVRAIPEDTLEGAFMPPPGSFVLNSERDLNPSLFCTIQQWRSTNMPPDRWLAILMNWQCQASP